MRDKGDIVMANLEGILDAVRAARAGAAKIDLDRLAARAAAESRPRWKQPKLLSGVKEICAYLGISNSTFYNWRKRGFPVSSAPGSNRIFIREDILLRWIGQWPPEEREKTAGYDQHM